MAGRSAHIARTIKISRNLDRDWQKRSANPDPARYTPWMPFDLASFITMLAEALPEAPDGLPGEEFLDIGCGPGSKMLIARDVFGLDAHGIEIDAEMAAAARTLGLDVATADALEFPSYGDYGIVWFNRPFRDPGLQAKLEARVWADMAPGAVVICANLEDRPPSSWFIVDDDWEARRGVWFKPPVSVPAW